jgi:photosystem I subunit 11
MSEFIKPYNNDPFVGNLATPVTSSAVAKTWLSNLPIYRKGVSPLLRGLEVGMAHGYFLIGPFYKLGPLRGSEVALLSGLFSTFGLVIILTAALTMYGIVSFDDEGSDPLQTSQGWSNFTAGFFVGASGGAGFVYLLLLNAAFII